MNYKLNLLDKAVSLSTETKFGFFSDWCLYETDRFGGEVTETAQVHRMFLHEGFFRRCSSEHTHVGCCGNTRNVSDFIMELNDGSVVLVGPRLRTHTSNYAHDTGWEVQGPTIEEFMKAEGIEFKDIRRMVLVRTDFSSWNETERERAVIIYGRDYSNKVLLESFKAITGLDTSVLHYLTQPKTVYGHFNMDSADLERIKKFQGDEREILWKKQEHVRDTLAFYFGDDKAKELDNFINFGD